MDSTRIAEYLAETDTLLGIPEGTSERQIRQESSMDPAAVSKAGARGLAQVIPATLDSLSKRMGRKLDPHNSDDALVMHRELMRENLQKFGNLPDALRAYNAGWDRSRWNNPETVDYVSRIYRPGADGADLLPATIGPAPVPATSAAPARSLQALYEAAKGPRPQHIKQTKLSAALEKIGATQPHTAPATAEDDWFKRASVGADDAVKAQQERDSRGFVDGMRAAMFGGGFTGDVLRWWDRPEFTPDGTVATEEELSGYTLEERDAIAAGSSVAERHRIRFELDDYKENQRLAGINGVGWALAYGAAAELPVGALTGLGTTLALAKVGLGSVALAGAGRTAAAGAALAAENVVPGLAMTAVQDYLTPFVHAEDYLLGAGLDLIGAGAGVPSVVRAARGAEDDALLQIVDTAVGDKLRAVQAARTKLGADASSEAVAQEAGRAQVEQINATVRDGRSSLGADRKLIPDDVNDVLSGDAADAGAPTFDMDADTFTLNAPPVAKHATEDPGFFDKHSLADRGRYFEQHPDNLQMAGEGVTVPAMRQMPAGVTVMPQAAAAAHMRPAIAAVQDLVRQLLPGKRVVLAMADADKMAATASSVVGRKVTPKDVGGVIYSTSDGHVIGLNPHSTSPTDAMFTATHEVGHAVAHEHLKDVPAGLLARMVAEHGEFIKDLRAGRAAARLKRFHEGSSNVIDANNALRGRVEDTAYVASFDEYTAEAFVRWTQRRAREGGLELPSGVLALMKAAWQAAKDLWTRALAKGYLPKDEAFDEFFERVLSGTLKNAERIPTGEATYLDADLVPNFALNPPTAPRTDADIISDYGLDTLATGTPAQRARQKAIVHLYRKAEAYPMPDPKRLSWLMSKAPMQWAASTSHTLLTSQNPVARMVAAELLENGAGAGGRRTTAALAKYLHEQEFMGNAVNDLQRHYVAWRNANGGGTVEDHFGGKRYAEFNRRVALLLENRLMGRADQEAPAVIAAADVLEAGYDRMRVAQQGLKTPGWASLPESSFGYMPHRMSAGKVREAGPAARRVLHQVLAEQFEGIEGFDADFSRALASKYMDIVTKRGTAGYSAPIGVHSVEAADIVQESAAAMGMSADEANALAKRVLKAAPAHTRHRLQLDLTRTYEADGQSFQLIDLFETDQLSLLRSQASRVSGEAALVKHGIMGSTGLKLLRDAMGDFGADGAKATNAELEAFDQVSAEFLGQPFGKQNGKWFDRATLFNSLVSLGGVGFNQAAETLNLAATLGVQAALSSVSSVRRLRAEIIALSKGQTVNNPIIGSLEVGGAEFGTGHYKLVFPFDNPHRPEVYGAEAPSTVDRLLRSGSHLQGKLSMWRAITAAQERGAAEQIVHKALRYIREGLNDKNLVDMGIDAELAAAIRTELPRAAQFDAQGRLLRFDITQMENTEAAAAFVQAVHRGSRQIIQGSFIGEHGKWVHSDVLRMMTQFRTFSLVAVEKQWNRVVGNHGVGTALGILLGTMAFSVPVIMIRAALASLGREDAEEYLQRRLSPQNLGRDTLNYVGLSGLSGDLLDALSVVAGFEATGGRSGANKAAVGNVVAPAVGRVNDVWEAIQNTREGTDVSAAVRQMPFSRLPFLLPAVNALRPEQ